jgi:hypothetical protein
MPILAQTSPVFQPAMRVINFINSSINDTTRIVTTTPHQYSVGMFVRINLPLGFRPQELNQKVGEIVEIIDITSFRVNIDSSQFGDFFIPAKFPRDEQYAQVTPVGEANSLLINATRNVLPY